MFLNKLKPAGKKRKRVGRGGSRGGTSGAGHKGQKARSGAKKGGFEGGQMPLTRRMPKRGFSNKRFARRYEIINLGLLNDLFEDGAVVSKQAIQEKGIISSKNALPVKVLAGGELTKKLTVYIDAWSQAAAEMVQKTGGSFHKPGEEA